MWSVYSCREGDSSLHPTGLRSAPASIPGIKVTPSLILHENISRNPSIMENICRVFSAGFSQGCCAFFPVFLFLLMIPGSLLSPPLPHRCQSGGEAGEEGKEAGPGWEWFSRGMLVNIKWVWIYKMVIQGDKIVIHRDNSHGRVGADGDSGLRERSRNRNKIGDLTNTGAVPGGVRVQNQL